MDVVVDVEDRHVEGDDHAADEHTDDGDHERLDERGELLGRRLDLLVVEVARSCASIVSSAPASSPTAIICVTIEREHRLLGQGLGDRLAPLRTDSPTRLSGTLDHPVARGLPDDLERLQDRHAGRRSSCAKLRVNRATAIFFKSSPKTGSFSLQRVDDAPHRLVVLVLPPPDREGDAAGSTSGRADEHHPVREVHQELGGQRQVRAQSA